jgi:hypothetical protein
MAIGDKKHIVAEQPLKADESINLCNVYRCDWEAYEVLSVYSVLSKQLLAYKVMHKGHADQDEWLSMPFNKKLLVSQTPKVQVVPNQFAQNNVSDQLPFVIDSDLPKDHKHILEGIAQWQLQKGSGQQLFVWYQDNQLLVVLFNQKQLQFSNVFAANTEHEVLYFIVAAIQAVQMEQSQLTLTVSYDLWQNTALINFLKPYFQGADCLRLPYELDAELLDLTAWLMPNELMAQCE